ncbi:MAG: ABC transporter permease [Chlamydiae bacterium RIFCSPHIGHO2_12_FULL_49_11]|nr:MAG: ABC transporter permease [Chlamydiae bacterium RIFCSPHIGHO2_12_FULL_49_11]
MGAFICFIGAVLKSMLRRFPRWELIRECLYSMGVTSLSVVSLTGFFTGLVLAAQSYYQLNDKGLAGVTGLMVAKAMLTELGPVLTALMIVGRVGASMTAELGTMEVTEQLDAMKSMAVDPNRFLIAPRFISGMIMFPILTIYSIVLGVFGGYLIAVYFFGMAPNTFWDPIPEYVDRFDLIIGMTKAYVFAFLIVSIACFKGVTTRGGAKGVGESTTHGVVIAYVVILFTNFFLTLGINVVRNEINRWFE